MSSSYDHPDSGSGPAPINTSPYDEVEMSYGDIEGENSPIDGSISGGEQNDSTKPQDGQPPAAASASQSGGSSTAVLGKPIGTNNFVTKLYQ